MPYNPFKKVVGEKLNKEDLQQLISNEVAEGYFVEYKGDTFPKNEKIAHSIASLANSYGGWYLIGVKTNSQHEASDICGFSLNDCKDPIDKIREIVKSHIDPVPVIYPQVVEITTERAVLVVYVPGNQTTPFVTKDGRIYRRNHDSSSPVPESSRYTIDKLVSDGRRSERRFKKFCSDDRVFSQSENSGWVNLFISPYPEGLIERYEIHSTQVIEELIQTSHSPYELYIGQIGLLKGNCPFTNAQPTFDSLILEQRSHQTQPFNSTMMELFIDGKAKLHIPLLDLQEFNTKSLEKLKSLKAREAINTQAALGYEKFHLLKFFDYTYLWRAIVNLLGFYHHWIGESNAIVDVRIAMEIKNVWRRVPFIDSDEWADQVYKFGLPILKRDHILIPNDIGKGMIVSYTDRFALWQTFHSSLCLGFGLPNELHTAPILNALKQQQNDQTEEE